MSALINLIRGLMSLSGLMSLRSALMGLTNAGKNGKNVFISVKILSKILGVLLASALMNLRSALMSLRSAPMSALMSLRSALMSLKSAGKNGKNVFISGIGIREVRNNRQPHVTYLFSHPVNQATGLQARQGDAVLEREKESSESLFIQHFAFLNTTVIAHRDIENYKLL